MKKMSSSMQMITFYVTFVRHGETQANKQKIIQGHQDTLLSDIGIRQAKLVAKRLAYEKFTHIFSSDLKRAHKTCEIIVEGNKETSCPIVKDKRLRERNFGIYQGRPSVEFRTAVKKSKGSGMTFVPPEGESVAQMMGRAVSFFQDLCKTLLQQAMCKEAAGVEAVPIKHRRNTGSFCSTSSEVFTENGAAENSSLKNDSAVCDSDNNSKFGSPARCHFNLGNMDIYDQDNEKNTVMEAASTDQPQYGCPNVSLSDTSRQRSGVSLSSVSSGRAGSFDDVDSVNVLVVSHGGLLKQMIYYFVEELDCRIPCVDIHACPVSPNTGVSQFVVNVHQGTSPPSLICLTLHDKDHLDKGRVRAIEKGEEA